MYRTSLASLAVFVAILVAVLGTISASTATPPVSIPYGDDTPAVGDTQSFEIWKGARPSPVTVWYDSNGESWAVTDAAIQAALDDINSITPNYHYIYGGRVTPGSTYLKDNCDSSNGQQDGIDTIGWWQMTGGTLARACIWSTRPECDVQLGQNIGLLQQLGPFQTILTHEMLHCSGLAHSDVAGSIMHPAYSGVQQIGIDDRQGVCFLYGGTCQLVGVTSTATVTVTATATVTVTPTHTPPPTSVLSRRRVPFIARDN